MLFKSKLEHTDPEIRRQHVEQMAADDEQLLVVAQADPHPEVRASAVTRIIDLQLVERLSQEDAEERIRSIATARLQSLMSGSETPAPSLDSRLGFLDVSSDQRLIRFVARSAREPELRKVAVNKLLAHQDQPLILDTLCEIACDDAISEIRESAAKVIHDRTRLQRLLENTRSKDKNIHRLAKERLEVIEKDAQARESLDQCCIDAEQLAASDISADGKSEEGRLVSLNKQWAEQSAELASPDKMLNTRFAAATDRIESRLKEIQAQNRQRTKILEAMRALSDHPDPSQLKELSGQWHELDDSPPAQTLQFEELLAGITRNASILERDEHRSIAKRAILKAMQERLETEIKQSTLARFEKRWHAAANPEDDSLNVALQSDYNALLEKTRHKLEKQARELEERIGLAAQSLDLFEAAVEAGKLKEADSAHHKIVNALGGLDAPEQVKRELSSRLRSGEARMSELRRWRHWGTERKRDELCEQAVALDEAKLKIAEVAGTVRKLRESWKALDKSDGPASKKIWQRFDKACEKAYAPCQQHFNEQKAKRSENMVQRVALCEKLEQLHKDTDWDSPNWRELSDKIREVQNQWRTAGTVDRRERNKIQKRYDLALAALNEPLNEIRNSELARREELISKVQALADAEDNRQAVETAKQAQRNWKPVVQSGRRQEQELWTRFRTACDAIFAKRKEHFAAADNERAQNLAEKLAVCGQLDDMAIEIQALAQADDIADKPIRDIKGKTRELQTGWRRIGQVPRNKMDKVERQFRDSCDKLTQLCRQAEQKIVDKKQQATREASATCDNLELAICNKTELDSALLERLLNESADTPALARRLKRLQKASAGDAVMISEIQAGISDNLQTKSTICLELEIAADIESPPEFQKERMQYRVQQLTKAMTGLHKQSGPEELQQQWFLTGPVPEAQQAEIEKRFKRAVEALKKD